MISVEEFLGSSFTGLPKQAFAVGSSVTDARRYYEKLLGSTFTRGFSEILNSRIEEAHALNYFSSAPRLPRLHCDRRMLFKQLLSIVASCEDQEARRLMTTSLTYIKPELPKFIVDLVDVLDVCGFQNFTASESKFVSYIYLLSHVRSQYFDVSALDYLGRNAKVGKNGMVTARYSFRTLGPDSPDDIYVGCSSADSIIFNRAGDRYLGVIALPGLSFNSLSEDLIWSLSEFIRCPSRGIGTQRDLLPLKLKFHIGFVDLNMIAGADTVLSIERVKAIVLEKLTPIKSAVKRFNSSNRDIKVTVHPTPFGVTTLRKPTVNGVVPWVSDNLKVAAAFFNELPLLLDRHSDVRDERWSVGRDAIHAYEIHHPMTY
jgi:hypothetical protein